MTDTDNRQNDQAFVMDAVTRVVAGDVEAFAVIVHAYQRLVAAELSRRLPAQDIQEVAQDVFVRAFRALPTYRHAAPFHIWLLRITRYAAMDFWRHKYRRRTQLLGDLDEAGLRRVEQIQQQRVAEQETDAAAHEAAREWLAAALARLSPDDRAIITLVELEEHSMEEAARRLGCGVSAAKVRAFRARRRLHTVLTELRQQKNR